MANSVIFCILIIKADFKPKLNMMEAQTLNCPGLKRADTIQYYARPVYFLLPNYIVLMVKSGDVVSTVVDIKFTGRCGQTLDACFLFKCLGIINDDFTSWVTCIRAIPD